MLDILGGVALPIALALAGWLGYAHKQLMSMASREAVQQHRLEVIETRLNTHSDRFDEIMRLLHSIDKRLARIEPRGDE